MSIRVWKPGASSRDAALGYTHSYQVRKKQCYPLRQMKGPVNHPIAAIPVRDLRRYSTVGCQFHVVGNVRLAGRERARYEDTQQHHRGRVRGAATLEQANQWRTLIANTNFGELILHLIYIGNLTS